MELHLVDFHCASPCKNFPQVVGEFICSNLATDLRLRRRKGEGVGWEETGGGGLLLLVSLFSEKVAVVIN